MLFDELLQPFLAQRPVAVMTRACLEYAFASADLDALFERVSTTQYHHRLTFSSLVDLLGAVVAVPAAVWTAVRSWTSEGLARWHQRVAAGADWGRYRKAKHGPKKSVVQVIAGRKAPHRSTARLIDAYRKTQAAPP
jgi:hypothetical protein